MSTRAIQARIQCDHQILGHLWRTHVVFNERLPSVISLLFRMKRGECGETDSDRRLYQKVATFVLACGSRDARYLLHSVSIKGWNPNTAMTMKATVAAANGSKVVISGNEWAPDAAALSAAGTLLYQKSKLLGDLPGAIKEVVPRQCCEIISGHEELVRRWEQAHGQWLERKAQWESDPEHHLYLALRPRFEDFEQSVGGKTSKRRGRWHLYLDWFRANPDLAAWRGGQPVVVQLSAAAKERIRKAKPWHARSVEAEEFWNANSELAALDRLHGYYEREFVRRRKTKKHLDGFDHRPTFTLPHAVRHPRWFVFNAPQTSPPGYRKLVLPDNDGEFGHVELMLLTGEKTGARYPSGWTEVKFKADPRMADFKRVTVERQIRKGAKKGQDALADRFLFVDRQLNIERPAQISGIKLLFRNVRLDSDGSLLSADPYLVFTCNIADVPLTPAAKTLKWEDTGERRKRVVLPSGLVTCAVDVGIRHVGFATVAVQDSERREGVRVLRSRNIWMGHEESEGAHPGRWCAGPELAHLSDHKRALRRLRRLRGKPIKGERSHTELQDHITDMASDRFKKAARAIINFALNVDGKADRRTGQLYPRADVLILENLATLLPDAERERGINKALVEFNRGHLVDRIAEVARDCGLKLVKVSPVGTSQVCSHCGALGRRYGMTRDKDSGCTDVHFGFVEPLFACPQCEYRANSDHNASVNLHRRLLLGDDAVRAFIDWRQKTKQERADFLRGIEQSLRPLLRRTHDLEAYYAPF